MQTIHHAPLADTNARLVGYLHDPADEYITKNVRPCVIVCPGGGYEILASHEAEPVAMRFYTAGYQVFVLYYSVLKGEQPATPPLGLTPLREASAAVMAVRENAAQWRIDPDKIAVCGFSAGGHLAGSIGVLWDEPELKAVQDTKNGANRPDAMILCYPVILMEEFRHQGSTKNLTGNIDVSFFSLERHVRADTPPAFLWHTADDESVPVENSLQFACALQKAGVSFESHIFAHGPHGLGLCDDPQEDGRLSPHCAAWMPLCIEWLNGLFEN